MSRSSSNSTVMLPLPWREEDEISLTPSTEVTASSTRSTTSVSMISGEAPSQVIEMFTTGKSTSGFWLIPRPLKTVPNAGEGQDAEPDEGEHQDPREHVVADRDVRQGHPGGDLLGVLLGLRRPTRLFAHGRSPTSPPAAGAAGVAARRPRLAPGHDLDRDPVGETVGALGHHRLARLQAREDLDDARARPQPQLDGPQLRRAVLHDVGDEALLARLDGALGHHERALPLLAGERHLGEEAGLELARVVDPGEDLDLAGGGVRDLARRGRSAR